MANRRATKRPRKGQKVASSLATMSKASARTDGDVDVVDQGGGEEIADEAFLSVLKEDTIQVARAEAEDSAEVQDEMMRMSLEEDSLLVKDTRLTAQPTSAESVSIEEIVSEVTVEPLPAPNPPARAPSSRKAPTKSTSRVSKAMMDHPPGKKSRMPRQDTERHMVLTMMMEGTRTPSEIALVMKKKNSRFDDKYVYAHAYCLFRDCGIGYETVEGKLRALFPEQVQAKQ